MTESFATKVILTIGHVYCGIVAVIATYLMKFIEKVARVLIGLGQNVTGAKIVMPEYHEQRCSTAPIYSVTDKDIVDEVATKQASTFSIPEDQLIEKAKEIIRQNIGCNKPELLSDDFLFSFPIVGPLRKAEFVHIYSSFGVSKAMSGSPNYFNFFVDPMEPNRVWFSSRGQYKHTGDIKFGPKVIAPTGKTVVTPPQMLSFSFNDAGQCYKFTGGYSVDKTIGNTEGLGGLFGILHALGHTLPFHEGHPWKPSLSWEAYAKHFPKLQELWK
eukprot:TRINITY_DN5392_c0_g1_i6.p1 TRINITY_DN5392_c0_g1~~TRINITY_DN5392_c0_g1_i6.p1  ORF type:complete len:272 (-),score=34.86 TRINITY_DN5392_c0_g1_i6:121-936(-)